MIDDFPPSIVRSWLMYELGTAKRRTDALAGLNAACGTCTTHSRLNEWLRGEREPARDVRRYMLRQCIEEVLREHGVKTRNLAKTSWTLIEELS